MKVKNVQPRLIRIDGVFIAPGDVVEVNDDAVGLSSFLARSVLVEVKEEPVQGDKKGAVEQEEPVQGDEAQPAEGKNKQADKSDRGKVQQPDVPKATQDEAKTTE